MASSGHILQCSVCHGEFCSKVEWHQHLITEEHQKRAREDVADKWAVTKAKDSTLVIYSSFPLTGGKDGGAAKIIQHFSQGPRAYVSDFVFWGEARPFVALLHLESREKIKQVLADAKGREVLVAGDRIEMRRASKLLQLEWKALFPCDYPEKGASERCFKRPLQPAAQNTGNPSVKRSRIIEVVAPPRNAVIPSRFTTPVEWGSLDPCPASDLTGLPAQLWQLRKDVSISDLEYSQALEIRRAVSAFLSQVEPNVEVALFRNWHLKLRNANWPASNGLLLYSFKRSQDSRWSGVPARALKEALRNPWNQDIVLLKNQGQLKYVHQPTGIPFTLALSRYCLAEVQLGRLLEYMIQFDTRCYPLLTLTFFWCQLNGVTFGETSGSESSLTEPHTLQWIVIFWFSLKKLVPSVREIQERPHEIVMQGNTDVGFHADPQFIDAWKHARQLEKPDLPSEENYASVSFISQVLKLFHEFLKFYGGLKNSCSILNTRDGEIISATEFIKTEDREKWADPSAWSPGGRLTRAELGALRFIQSKSPEVQTLFRESGLEREALALYHGVQFRTYFPGWRLYIIQPFSFTRNFSMGKRVAAGLRAMDMTAGKLKDFLCVAERRNMNAAMNQFGMLADILKVTE